MSKLLIQAGLVCLMVVGVGLAAVGVGHYLLGGDLQVGLLATLICALSAAGAHVASEFPKGNEYILLRMVTGMAVRTAPPLLFALWALKFADPPLEKSVVFYIILLYFVGLIADLFFNVSRLKND